MSEPLLQDRDQIMASFQERNEELLAAGRQTQLELVDAFKRTLCAVADSHEQLAETSDVEWVSRLFRAQATLTRDMCEASCKFAHQILDA
jgi:hypothetical protein